MIRGSAFATTVEARMDTNMPTIRPERAWRTSRRDMRVPTASDTSAGGAVVVIDAPFRGGSGLAGPGTDAPGRRTGGSGGGRRIGQAGDDRGERLVHEVAQWPAVGVG